MSTYIIYTLIALGVILATRFIFKKFIPSEWDFIFTRTNLKDLQNGLTFDPSLSFFRLKKHYEEKIENKKVFKFSPQKMEKFKNSATNVLANHIINMAKNSGSGISVIVLKELDGSFKILQDQRYEILKSVLQGLSHHTDFVNALRKELYTYEKNLEESKLKENPEKIREICVNKLVFFFVNINSFDTSETKLFDLFQTDYERLRNIIDLKPHIPLIKEQKSAQSS